MADELQLLGPDGRPVRRRELTREAGRPTVTGVRQLWRGESIASGLTPQRLASLLRAASEGSHRDYLTLAEEMEERDPHYAAVLGSANGSSRGSSRPSRPPPTPPRTSSWPTPSGSWRGRRSSASCSTTAWTRWARAFRRSRSSGTVAPRPKKIWRPARYEWRDPRFFIFDRDDGRTLRLLDEADSSRGVPLQPCKWIVHVPRLKSGLPARGGLARLVALAYMVKAYALTDWTAFAEVFGMPLRLGRYGPGATEADIEELMRAVAHLGTDAAAVLPDSMRIEFTEVGNRTGGGDLFERLAVYLDKQVSKAVLGQTMTADDGSSRAQAEVHDEVRGDILRSDARQLANTLNRALVRPFIDLNHGPRARGKYPRLLLPVSEPEDIRALTAALEKLTPLGLRVEASVIRDKLGLPDPADGAELLGRERP